MLKPPVVVTIDCARKNVREKGRGEFRHDKKVLTLDCKYVETSCGDHNWLCEKERAPERGGKGKGVQA